MDLEWYRFGAALAIGALVGLERHVAGNLREDEVDDPGRQTGASFLSADSLAPGSPPASAPPGVLSDRWAGLRPAGLRTHMLVALSGAVAAYLATQGAGWIFAASFLAVAILTVASYLLAAQRDNDLGQTSEVTVLLVFMLGGLCSYGQTVLAGACAVITSVILSLKPALHSMALRIRPQDIHATLKFGVLSLVVLPILPSEPLVLGSMLGELDPSIWWHTLEISPRKIWLMVVLISAVSFVGYVAGKLLGAGRGLLVTGAVGGLVSSTAVTLSFAQQSQNRPELSRELGAGVLLANAIMPARLLLVSSVIAPSLFLPSVIPLLAMVLAVGIAMIGIYLRSGVEHATASVALRNPFEIGPALKFGAVFGVVLFLAQVLQQWFGDAGLYALAILTGLTDVDAIGLAVAAMVSDGKQDPLTGMIVIVLAAISNTVVKGGFIATLASPELRRLALAWFGAMVVAGGLGAVIACQVF